MNIIEELKNIEKAVVSKTNEAVEIKKSSYPLCSSQFMNKEDIDKINMITKEVEVLARKYTQLYNKLSNEEKYGYEYKNIMGNYNKALREIKGLIMVDRSSDEYELHEAFDIAYKFAKEAIEKMVEAEKANNKNEYDRNFNIINCCTQVFRAHFWGDSYLEDIKKYESRIRIGITIDEDISEYNVLVLNAKQLAENYAKAILNGITKEDKVFFDTEFKSIFKMETELLNFIPIEVKSQMGTVNFHWLKLDAEKNPQKLLNDIEEERNKKRK